MADDTDHDTDDHRAITTVLARYGSTLDREAHDEWLALFTDDAEYHVFGRPLVGHDALRRMAENAPPGLHIGALPVIEIDGDRASAGQSFLFVDRVSHELRIGWYDDDLVKQDGRWLIRTRRCTFSTPTGPSDRP